MDPMELSKAKGNLKNITRILMCDKYKDWPELIYNDLGIELSFPVLGKKSYSSDKKRLRNSIEKALLTESVLTKYLEDEYKLYEYARSSRNT